MNQPKKRKSSLAMFSEVLKSDEVKNELNEIYNTPTISKKEGEKVEKNTSQEEPVSTPVVKPELVQQEQKQEVKIISEELEKEGEKVEKNISQEKPASTPVVKPELVQQEQEQEVKIISEELEKEGEKVENKESSPKSTTGKKEKEPAKEYTTIRIDKKKVTALLILAKSGEFPGISNQTEMLDYILNYYCDKKKITEILKKGIQF